MKINTIQRIIIGLIFPVVVLLIGYGIMDKLPMRVYPDRLDTSWGGWLILIVIIGVFETIWFRSKD